MLKRTGMHTREAFLGGGIASVVFVGCLLGPWNLNRCCAILWACDTGKEGDHIAAQSDPSEMGHFSVDQRSDPSLGV